MEQDLKDRVGIVTGGAQGIGKAIAMELAGHGARIVVADINLETAQKTADEIVGNSLQAIALTLNVADSASVSAMVKEILPNGNLLIDASRRVRHDDDLRVVHLTGIVRPIDVAADNTVLSTSIAEARISYEGYGPAARTKRKGWGNRVLDTLWPF